MRLIRFLKLCWDDEYVCVASAIMCCVVYIVIAYVGYNLSPQIIGKTVALLASIIVVIILLVRLIEEIIRIWRDSEDD